MNMTKNLLAPSWELALELTSPVSRPGPDAGGMEG